MIRSVVCFNLVTTAAGTVYFSEGFGKGWEDRWVLSKWKESEGTAGKWQAATGRWFHDEVEDMGLQTAEDSKFFGISASFDSFSNAGKTLVVQFQAKYEKDIECGGGYVKIGAKMPDPTAFGDPTPYNIMFGPDKCGNSKRTHLIFNYKGKNYLKKKDLEYKQDKEGTTHLYRLVLKPDNSISVEVDNEQIYAGSLLTDFDIIPEKEITDPEDKKPKDWVDLSTMEDPEDQKPADWIDEKRLPDASAAKPDDWDDEEDGDWEAPMIDNPAFQGAWVAKRIPNPAFKGAWTARKLPNPDYFEDDNLYKYDDFGFIGFDLWQVKGGTIFDNIIITDDPNDADALFRKWRDLTDVEKKGVEEEDARKREEEAAKEAASGDDDEEDLTPEDGEEM